MELYHSISPLMKGVEVWGESRFAVTCGIVDEDKRKDVIVSQVTVRAVSERWSSGNEINAQREIKAIIHVLFARDK